MGWVSIVSFLSVTACFIDAEINPLLIAPFMATPLIFINSLLCESELPVLPTALSLSLKQPVRVNKHVIKNAPNLITFGEPMKAPLNKK